MTTVEFDVSGGDVHRLRRGVAREAAALGVDVAVSPAGLAVAAARHGLEAEALRHVPETEDHVGSEVVVLRG